ncbi:hypothetical protein [Acidomonas methanolica]|uniref:Uncharacterized protein n=1 Tax=Acidomonas methanolica NBRC 104435 TaxID=1231351 RepID=A0A023D4G4_ACIMT|nr:hypothetical protein [Acidomonas methanolica]MBU2653278.1 hypothetical protein [Acidomonas methanolica]GAJ29032.1 hypothetical protein Amme_041_066 [Acidomonas methanolica NBRC 104435]GBQ53002.1 hypothetical protein AA0498_1852 [Acidomonas methanolica]GEK97662.1 hypothetical protein AME01nite_01610 [Acidomonas methanolica NBRC 104435]
MSGEISAHERSLNSPGDRARAALLSSRLACGLVLLASLAACNPYSAPLKAGNDLALAGFIAHPADTTARQEMMNLLPPEMLTYRPSTAGPIMLYADPKACGCVYFGDQRAYRQYLAHRPETRDARNAMVADNNQHPGWDWSVWARSADPAAITHLEPGYVREPGWN